MISMRLTDFVWFQRGFDLPQSKFEEGDIPVFGSTSILGYHNIAKVKAPGIITGRSGTLGKFQYAETDFWPHNTTLWVKDFKGSDPKFAYYLLQCLDFTVFNSGGAVPSLNRNLLNAYIVNVPPLKTQKKIASILSGYDDLIENNLKRIKILEEMAQQTYEEWFVRMRFPGHESATINSETGLPEGWEKKKINDVADFSNGYAFYTKGYSDEETCYKVIDLGNIAENSDLKISGKEKCISEDLYLSSSKFYLNKNDIIIAMTDVTPALGILAKSAIINASNTYVLNQRVGRIRCEKEIDYSYVYAILNDRRFIERMKSLTKGAVQFYFNTKDICNYEFVIPDNEILKKFVSIYQPFLVLRDSLKAQNQRLREARDILLPRLMMGMIEV